MVGPAAGALGVEVAEGEDVVDPAALPPPARALLDPPSPEADRVVVTTA